MSFIDKTVNRVLKWENIEVSVREMVDLIQKEILQKCSDEDLISLEKGLRKGWILGIGAPSRYYPSYYKDIKLRLRYSTVLRTIQEITLQDTAGKKEYFLPRGKSYCDKLRRAVLHRIAIETEKRENPSTVSVQKVYTGKYIRSSPTVQNQEKTPVFLYFMAVTGIIACSVLAWPILTKPIFNKTLPRSEPKQISAAIESFSETQSIRHAIEEPPITVKSETSRIDAYSGEATSIPQPTEPISIIKPAEPTVSISVQDDTIQKTYIEGYVMYGTGGLNIRNGPGVSYEQIGILPDGERVTIQETQYSGTAEWGRIERGWICMAYIQIGVPESVGMSEAGETFETDFFFITLPDNCNDKYVLEHNYSSRSEYLVFYYKSEYEYYKGTYSEPGGWPFAIEIRTDGTECSAIAGWDHIGSVNIYEDSLYELYLHYPMDPQFMDGSYYSFLADARSIADSIVAKDGYAITIF